MAAITVQGLRGSVFGATGAEVDLPLPGSQSPVGYGATKIRIITPQYE
jgi:hypothetical protein